MKTGREIRELLLRVGAVAVAFCAAAAWLSSHLIVNCTESLPLGLYWLSRGTAVRVGRLIAFPIPEPVRELVRERHYLPARALLLKEVVAAEGDEVCAKGGVLAVDGVFFGPIASADRSGRPLPHAEVCGALPRGRLFVASRHPRSFDSRTFGPIDADAVRGTVTPLWTL